MMKEKEWISLKLSTGYNILHAVLLKNLTHRWKKLNNIDCKTPKIKFLYCSIYRLLHDQNIGNPNVLVEDRIDQYQWHKWDCNNEYVDGMKRSQKFNDIGMNEII